MAAWIVGWSAGTLRVRGDEGVGRSWAASGSSSTSPLMVLPCSIEVALAAPLIRAVSASRVTAGPVLLRITLPDSWAVAPWITATPPVHVPACGVPLRCSTLSRSTNEAPDRAPTAPPSLPSSNVQWIVGAASCTAITVGNQGTWAASVGSDHVPSIHCCSHSLPGS